MISQIFRQVLSTSIKLTSGNTTNGCLTRLKNFRQISSTSNSAAYDGDGRTTVRVLNNNEPNINLVNSYSSHGFRLSNNLYINGSIILFPTHVYAWNIKRAADINMDSLIVFELIVPKVKIIVIGYGNHGDPFDASIALQLKKKGISCEMLPTTHAVTTYNYLAADAVHVAGAFIPIKEEVQMTQKDYGELAGYDYLMEDREHLSLAGHERDPLKYYQELKAKVITKDKGKTKFDE